MPELLHKIKRKIARIGLDPEWDTIIKPRTGWFDINLREVWRYRDLIKIFVYRDFVVYYKQTILGPLWWLIQPLFTSGMFTLIFGAIAGLPTDGVPTILFYLSGVVCWSYFSDCLLTTSNTFTANAAIFGKVYFPRLVVPVSTVLSGLIKFAIQFALFLVIYLIYLLQGAAVQPSFLILALPLLLAQMAALALGLGIIASSLTTKYRDLALAMTFFVQLMMYATPVVYPLSMLPEKWRPLAMLNPMAPVIEFFRLAFLGAGSIDFWTALWSVGFTLLILFLGVIFFSRVEKSFMDTV
ncbi:lipopolysaccharide transport system permease protein [Candidatus Termititenax aidoneus]|uniref:Transport permease protein n=1 Tax=Termititenax aidoneus TaxID=2218524 RepID=A0A388T8S9_TERA1|nr:lipopolysaccharide transport system permease protein [Candidatus Termititenax aidoneus]